jgi:protein tyrosine/serine phosphatase
MKIRALPGSLALASALALSVFTVPAAVAEPVSRPANWASAVAGTSVGNLYLVEPGLYRSAQPSAAGFRELEALGIKSVLDVSGGDLDVAGAKGTKIKLFHVPMTAFGLRDSRVLEALAILSDPANRPLLIHCHHGADRTGAMVALYRVLFQGWTREDAVREMAEGGYHHSSLWRNLDRYVLQANVAGLKARLETAKTRLASTRETPAPTAGAAAVLAAPAAVVNP